MNTPKTTAIDWLQEKIQSNLSEPMSPKFAELFDRANAMFQKQIEQAYVDGCLDTYGVEAMGIVKSDEYYAEQYYNQTYGRTE